jgi:hypothetical protein
MPLTEAGRFPGHKEADLQPPPRCRMILFLDCQLSRPAQKFVLARRSLVVGSEGLK